MFPGLCNVLTGWMTLLCLTASLWTPLLVLGGSAVEGTSDSPPTSWSPFKPVTRPLVPQVPDRHVISPIDAFLSAERNVRQLTAQPEASRDVLLRRVFMDLIGLNPTPAERNSFLLDNAPNAYERLVDRLLADPRYGERWGRHWMDIWRYSDWAGWTDGGQVRDSKPHIWKWRDWIVESLNSDKPYDQMLVEMLAADEIAPENADALRATGFLVRNYKMLSREQWLEDTIKHTSQALLGMTVGCAKCHDHLFDPISQLDYYRMRAIFEPHQVRTDRVPPELNAASNGLARVYDAAPPPTYLFHRGDERQPLTNSSIAPGLPASFGGTYQPAEVQLPRYASHPDEREFVIEGQLAELVEVRRKATKRLQEARQSSTNDPAATRELELKATEAASREKALTAVIAAERASNRSALPTFPAAELDSRREIAAREALQAQREQALAEAELKFHQASSTLAEVEKKLKTAEASAGAASAAEAPKEKETLEKASKEVEGAKRKQSEAEKVLAEAKAELARPATTAFKPRPSEIFPTTSTGRRLAFARWATDPKNPLTPRVAVNHIWMRHFGKGLVSTPSDLGKNGRPPTHPALLDWLAAEFIEKGWSMKALHRQLVLTAAYRMTSQPNPAFTTIDPDNLYLWRMNSRRLEAEAVRDNLLHVAGNLDGMFGGPDIDHKLAMTSRRRSIYLRHAAEKQAEFLQIFDGASVTECYERHPSVMPQQALALANSSLAIEQAKRIARELRRVSKGEERKFVDLAFLRILARPASAPEREQCLEFLRPKPASTVGGQAPAVRRLENLILVLLNHNDFVTIR